MFLCFTSSACTTDSRQAKPTQPKPFIEPNAPASDVAAQESLSADSLPAYLEEECLEQPLEHQEFLFLAKMELTAGSLSASFRLG